MESRVLRIIAFFTIFFLVSGLARSQWKPDTTVNTPVCTAPNQQDMPEGCTDGANGAIFVWEDSRGSTSQIYAQHLDAMGVAQWPVNGIRVAATSTSIETAPIVVSDDNGGAYVVWSDSRNSNTNGVSLYAQHILANGTLTYKDTGLPVAIGLNGCYNPTLCDDGHGGAFVAWEDNRRATNTSSSDIWVNRLWTDTVKYGLTTSGKGTDTTITIKGFHSTTYYYYFHDGNAHFKPYMAGLNIVINGTAYPITTILSDTEIQFTKTHPDPGNWSYYIPSLCGLAVDTNVNKQFMPTAFNNGKGGFYLTWINGQTSPSGLYGTMLDSTCSFVWGDWATGTQLYISSDVNSPVKNYSIQRDSNQLILAIQDSSTSANSQQISALRLQDSVCLWGSPVSVTSGFPRDKLSPLVFSDDSAISGVKGVMVPFMDAGVMNGSYDIAMVRVEGSGGDLLPPVSDGYLYFEQKNNMHNHLQAMKVSNPNDPTGTQTGLLAVWADAWDGEDTMIYAQRMDRVGRKYFPTMGTQNLWGEAIATHTPNPAKPWSERQPCIVPRTDGAIVAWSDFRSGSGDIYAQLVMMDGALWIPYDTTPPTITVTSSTPPDNDSACNAQCSTANIQEVTQGNLKSGLDSVFATNSNNMSLQLVPYTKGADQATFTVCVVDSFLDGNITVTALDTSLNTASMTFNYCTIPDLNKPVITIDSSHFPKFFIIDVNDSFAWSRGLSSVTPQMYSNLTFTNGKITAGQLTYTDTGYINDSTKLACFNVTAKGVAGTMASVNADCYIPTSASVSAAISEPLTLSVYPNPILGSTVVRLDGAPGADVTVLDILGHVVDQFRVEGSHSWNPSALPAGIYIVRATTGESVISKSIEKE